MPALKNLHVRDYALLNISSNSERPYFFGLGMPSRYNCNKGFAHIPPPPPPEPEKKAQVGRPAGKTNQMQKAVHDVPVIDGQLPLPIKRTRPGAVGRRGRGGRTSNV